MPRLPGCLFKFIQKKPLEVFILLVYVRKLKRCSQKFLTKFSRKTPVLESLFKNLLKKRLWRSCFPVNFASFFSQNNFCNLGDCQQMLLLFIDLSLSLSLTFLNQVARYSQVAILYLLCLFYNLAIFYDSCSYLSGLLFLIPKTEFVSSFAFVLCSPFLPTEHCQTVLLIEKCETLFSRLFLARQNATRIFRIILNIIAFYHSG